MLSQGQKKTRNDGKLIHAVFSGDVVTVQSELAQGDIDLQLKFGGKSFLRHAGERGDSLVVSYLLESGADPNERQGATNYTLLHSAVASHNYGFARLLLENGAEPSPRNSYMATPLHFAARLDQAYLAQLLIDKRADIEALDSHGRTPLFLAIAKGNRQVARTLVKAQANTSVTNKQGKAARAVAEANGIDLSNESFSFVL